MIRELVSKDHPLLHQELPQFDFSNPPVNPIELANDLIETMIEKKGIGLAANQVGLPYRVFVLYSEEPLACFNPRVIDETSDEIVLEEGCLTFPMLSIPIKRPKAIKVRFTEANGNVRTEKFVGMTARCFLHELDHLNGIDYTRKANQFHLQRALKKQKILLRQQKKMAQLDI